MRESQTRIVSAFGRRGLHKILEQMRFSLFGISEEITELFRGTAKERKTQMSEKLRTACQP
jgi:hypothetical protein